MNLLTKTTFMIKTIYFMFFICMFAVAMVACKGKLCFASTPTKKAL